MLTVVAQAVVLRCWGCARREGGLAVRRLLLTSRRTFMRITDDQLTTLREDGYIVVEGFLSPDEIATSQKLLADVYPTWEEYAKKPNWFQEVTGSPTSHWALKQFPSFPSELHMNV